MKDKGSSVLYVDLRDTSFAAMAFIPPGSSRCSTCFSIRLLAGIKVEEAPVSMMAKAFSCPICMDPVMSVDRGSRHAIRYSGLASPCEWQTSSSFLVRCTDSAC